MIISVLKKEAREKLKGKWKKAILLTIMFYITNILIGFCTNWISVNTQYGLMALMINIITVLALNYGLLISFVKIKRNEKVNIFHFIYLAARDVEKVWKNIGRLFLKFSGYIILLLFFAYLTLVEVISLYYGNGIRLTFFIEIILTLILTVWYIIRGIDFALIFHVLFDNTNWKAKQVLKESERLMKNHRWDFAKLNLSFLGWFALGIVVSVGVILMLYFWAGINNYYLIYINYLPLIFLFPYFYMTLACFYDNLLYNNPRPKEEETINKKTKKKNKKSK